MIRAAMKTSNFPALTGIETDGHEPLMRGNLLLHEARRRMGVIMSEKPVHVKIGARMHEEAAVVSARFQLPLKTRGGLSALMDSLTAGMRQLNAWAEENGVIIGHVKGYIGWGQEAVMLSTTGGDVQVKGSTSLPEPPCTAEVGVAAIVFGVAPDAVEERMEQFIGAALEGLGFPAAVEHEEEHAHEHGEDCCCEHDHHHDHGHGEDCCGEHAHHHDHEHGEDCGEHAHHHDHEHGEDCGEHAHHHNHDHDHK
jgi:hypothetical protein